MTISILSIIYRYYRYRYRYPRARGDLYRRSYLGKSLGNVFIFARADNAPPCTAASADISAVYHSRNLTHVRMRPLRCACAVHDATMEETERHANCTTNDNLQRGRRKMHGRSATRKRISMETTKAGSSDMRSLLSTSLPLGCGRHIQRERQSGQAGGGCGATLRRF